MTATDPAQLIEALQARGAQRFDALRFGQIEALQRRAAAHQGKTRQWLDQRLRQLLAAYAQAADEAQPARAPEPRPAPTALAGLLQHLARQGVAYGPAGAELRAVSEHRGTWARLSLERQLQQSLATVPDQAGPLNTQRLLHQALTLMQQAAPAYAQRFMAHVDALLWLDQSGLAGTPARKDAPRSGRRPPRP